MMRKKQSYKTYEKKIIQWFFYSFGFRALTVQLLVSILFLFVPIAAFVGVYVLQLRHGSIYANLCISVAGFDIIFNCLSVLYFVKPYNLFIRRKWKRRFTVHTITSSERLPRTHEFKSNNTNVDYYSRNW